MDNPVNDVGCSNAVAWSSLAGSVGRVGRTVGLVSGDVRAWRDLDCVRWRPRGAVEERRTVSGPAALMRQFAVSAVQWHQMCSVYSVGTACLLYVMDEDLAVAADGGVRCIQCGARRSEVRPKNRRIGLLQNLEIFLQLRSMCR